MAGAQTRCEQRKIYCSTWRIDPSPSTVLVPMAVPKVLAALNLARQMTTVVLEPASIKWSFRRPLLARRARDKDAVRHRVVNERRLPKPPKSQHWVSKHLMVHAKEALVSIAVCIIYIYLVRTNADF